jgi:hypothetical protein
MEPYLGARGSDLNSIEDLLQVKSQKETFFLDLLLQMPITLLWSPEMLKYTARYTEPQRQSSTSKRHPHVSATCSKRADHRPNKVGD